MSQAVRYGRLVLDNQPLRDHATVCLCTLALVQFLRVHRSTPTIHLTAPQSIVVVHNGAEIEGPGMAQLYAYLTAPAPVHGVRLVFGPKYVCFFCLCSVYIYFNLLSHQFFSCTVLREPQLGKGSFSTVVPAMYKDTNTNTKVRAALKLYQREKMNPESAFLFDDTLFQNELAILQSIAISKSAAAYAPKVEWSDPTLQCMLLTPVGEPLDFAWLTRDVAGQLVDALRALHQVCIHRDLRPANILVVGWPLKVLIIDFNLALSVKDAVRPQLTAGAPCVQSFGVLKANGSRYTYSPKDDLHSLVRTIFLLAYRTAIPPV